MNHLLLLTSARSKHQSVNSAKGTTSPMKNFGLIWAIITPENIKRKIKKYPAHIQARVLRAQDQMAQNAIHGPKIKCIGNHCRYRLNGYRLAYTVSKDLRIAEVHYFGPHPKY